jgi:hypothetical protein
MTVLILIKKIVLINIFVFLGIMGLYILNLLKILGFTYKTFRKVHAVDLGNCELEFDDILKALKDAR